MSKTGHPYQDEQLGAELPREAPPGQVNDPSYKTRQNVAVPVIDDDAPVEDPMSKLGSAAADSDKQLEQDDREAIDTGNIMKERTRKAKPTGTYTEPSDEQMGLKEPVE
ncbi:hypothetical protein C8A00DRAFT_37202 [Chaetomidium leptoderma]|uniref:Histone chaperone domain-containing protein n=1 Tax=Chaetomidium leptoderma TaxID=669021 RepID=A0AAN6VEW7_9PEZI|nr:hypothetical protein C8A00DRAFT_37202 [Chaetomidium leptoderma]